jgi:hypothetical protein
LVGKFAANVIDPRGQFTSGVIDTIGELQVVNI